MQQKGILIIEDERLIAEILYYKLSKEGYEIKCSGTGQEGLNAIPLFMPDLLLLDITLPDILGFNYFKKLVLRYFLIFYYFIIVTMY